MDSFHSMNRYVSPYVVYVEHNAQSTMLCNLPGMAFHVYFWVIPDVPPEYFIHQESSLPAKCLQQGQKLLSIAGLPLPISSTRNNLFLLQGVFNMARILLGNAGPPLTISSTSNHPFLCQGTFNKARIMLDIANLPLTIQSTINHHFHVFSGKIMLVIASLSYNGLIQVKEEGWTGFSEGWQGCSEGFPKGKARGKS